MGSNNDNEIVGQWLSCDQIDDAIAEIVRWFRDKWTPPGGLPFFSCDSDGRLVGGMDLLTDLADYLPFLHLAGAEDYVRDQVTIALRRFNKGHIIWTPRPRRGLLQFWPRANPFYSTDFLLGLVILHRLDSKLVDGEQLISVTRRILQTYVRDGWMSKEVLYPFRWRLPLSESDSLLFVEMLAEIYYSKGESEFLVASRRLMECWLSHPYTKTWGLVPQLAVLSPIWRNIRRFSDREVSALLYKHNTAFLAGLLALHRIGDGKGRYKEAVHRLIDSVGELLLQDNGLIYFQWFADDVESKAYGITLGSCNYIEVLLDAYEALGRKEDFETALRIADYWIKLQSEATGLVPESPDIPMAWMDHQTDFAVNLHRLYHVTNNADYLTAAVRIVQGQLRYHRTSNGYINCVHAVTGIGKETSIETRYSSLFLKALWLLKHDVGIWDDPDIRWVMKDR